VLRFSLSRDTTQADVEGAIAALAGAAHDVEGSSGVSPLAKRPARG